MSNEFLYWKQILETEINKEDGSFANMYIILRDMKQKHISKDVAYKILASVREAETVKKNEAKDDIVLDLMDLVMGHCAAEIKIW